MGNDSDTSSSSQRTKRTHGDMYNENPVTVDSIRNLLREQSSNIEKTICDKFDTFPNNIAISINKVCNERHSVNSAQFDQLSSRVSSLQNQLDDEQDRIGRLADIIVRGVPELFNENENVQNIAFGTASGHKNHPIRNLTRIATKNKSSSNNSPILVKFSSLDSKNLFMKRYFEKKLLSLYWTEYGCQNLVQR